MSGKGRKRVHLDVRLPEELHSVLQSLALREGKSQSQIVLEALNQYLYRSELGTALEKAAARIASLEASVLASREETVNLQEDVARLQEEVSLLGKRIKNLADEIEDLKKWERPTLFFAVLLTELIKARVFKLDLSDREYDFYKKNWRTAHQIADSRVEVFTGERVWRERFDPLSRPDKEEK